MRCAGLHAQRGRLTLDTTTYTVVLHDACMSFDTSGRSTVLPSSSCIYPYSPVCTKYPVYGILHQNFPSCRSEAERSRGKTWRHPRLPKMASSRARGTTRCHGSGLTWVASSSRHPWTARPPPATPPCGASQWSCELFKFLRASPLEPKKDALAG